MIIEKKTALDKQPAQYDPERLSILMDLLTAAAAEQDKHILKYAKSANPQERDAAASSLLVIANAYYGAAQQALQKHKSLLGSNDVPQCTTKRPAKL